MKTKLIDYNAIDWHAVFIEDNNSLTRLRWKIDPSYRIKAGTVAGGIHNDKQRGRRCFVVKYNKTSWYIHRILYVMRNGSIDSSLEIDHIDGNSLNNSVANLRLVSGTINNRNQKQRADNSTGITGVCFRIIKGNTYVITHWCNIAGKRKFKHFSCSKLGLLVAFATACAYREQRVKELNNRGAGYSKRHGT